MKLNSLIFLALAALPGSLLLPAAVHGQTPFTYQGKLENGGAPYTGNADIQLDLYDAATGGIRLRRQSILGVTVTGGIFTVTPTVFLPGDFAGGARWLEISVSQPNQAYTVLTPRQPVTYTPLAMHAATAGTVSGPITTSLSLPNAGTALSFGSATRQMINLWGTDYGIGVQAATLYQRSNSDFSWFKGGAHSDVQNAAGTNGSETMRLTGGGSLIVAGTASGFYQKNRANPANTWATYSDGAGTADSFRIWSSAAGDRVTVSQAGNLSVTGGVSTASVTTGKITGSIDAPNDYAISGIHFTSTGTGAGVYGISGSDKGFGVFGQGADGGYGGKFVANGNLGYAVYGVSDTGYAGYFNGKLHVSGSTTFQNEVTTQGTNAGFVVKNRGDQSKRWVMYSRNSGPTDQLAFYSDTSGDVASLSPNGDMYLVGGLSTTVLTIRGGADVAEPFDMTGPGEMEPGSVVVIDENNPGKLRLSTEARDTRVAGIISGAGGVKPGLRLHQEGVMEGDHHVALSGRVYVKADASTGGIRPGDLLTTSEKPGHAMKVTDHAASQGAILGKAMSKLDEGTGLVLVLVTLQ
ncbi:MAG: hypothetical protein V4726_03135 [Verrucomicrobiota bacterium]